MKCCLAAVWLSITASAALAQPGSDQNFIRSEDPSRAALRAVAMTPQERVEWIFGRTFGPSSLALGAFNAGIQTWRRRPEEWSGTWEGFGQRYGTRTARALTQSVIEAGVGAVTGEDPRYYPSPDRAWTARLRWAVTRAFVTRRADLSYGPAYGRFAGAIGASFVVNNWLPPSNNQWHDALRRGSMLIGWKTVNNVFKEFWPDLRRKLGR